jgi:hypothetical protein
MRTNYLIYSILLFALAVMFSYFMKKWEKHLLEHNEIKSAIYKSRKFNNRVILILILISALIFLIKSWIE